MKTPTLHSPTPDIIDQWQLPRGWQTHADIQLPAEPRMRGASSDIVMAYRTKEWMFSVRTSWLPLRCRSKATEFSQLTLEEFKQALELKATEAGVHNKASP